MSENEISRLVVDLGMMIHRKLGPGLMESAYESILVYELGKLGVVTERQVPLPLLWDEMLVQTCYRADIIIEHRVLVELKSVEKLAPVHGKQLLTYLRISGLKLGLLMNFGAAMMVDGIHRVVNGLAEDQVFAT